MFSFLGEGCGDPLLRELINGGLECFTGGVEVRTLRRNFAEWEAAIPARFDELRIGCEDAAGNVAWDWARTI